MASRGGMPPGTGMQPPPTGMQAMMMNPTLSRNVVVDGEAPRRLARARDGGGGGSGGAVRGLHRC